MMLAGVFGWYVYANLTAETRVREACARIAETFSVQDANALIEQAGVGPRRLKQTGRRVVAEEISFGRHACIVETENGHVTSSRYSYAD